MAYTAAKAGWEVLTGDVMTALLDATLPEHVFVLPPPNLRQEGRVWRLNNALYGLRRSPQLWQEHLAACLNRAGFQRGTADPTLYVHREHGWVLTAHVDDLFISAPKNEREKVKEVLSNEMVVKWLGIIERDGWTKFLGREWQKSDHGFIVRVPPCYYERILADSRLAECKAVCTPVEVGSAIPNIGGIGSRGCTEDEELNEHQIHDYRHTLGQLMWTLSERPDLNFAVKELARNMSKPTIRNAAQLKRVLRYLRGTTEAHLHLTVDQAEEMVINGMVGGSWASGAGRKSTSGGVIKLQGFLPVHWSKTQVAMAQSSCEAEVVAMNVGAVEAVFTRTLLDEAGVQANIVMKSDSTSGIALMHRADATSWTWTIATPAGQGTLATGEGAGGRHPGGVRPNAGEHGGRPHQGARDDQDGAVGEQDRLGVPAAEAGAGGHGHERIEFLEFRVVDLYRS